MTKEELELALAEDEEQKTFYEVFSQLSCTVFSQ